MAFLTSSTLLIIGIIIPFAPKSRIFLISAELFDETLTMGFTPHKSITLINFSACVREIAVCSKSIVIQS